MRRDNDEMLDDLGLLWEEHDDRRRGRPVSRQQRQRRKKENKRQRRSFGALFVSMLLLAALGGGVFWGVGWVQDRFGVADYESNPATTPVHVVVKPGDGATAIGEELFEKKVVASVKAFVEAAKANEEKSKNIQPGTYQLFEEMPAKTALAYLLDPAKHMVVDQVTIREGLTAIQTFKKLAEATGIPEKEFTDAAKDPIALGVQDWWFKRGDGKKVAGTIEGFLFPDTYRFAPEASAEEILKTMVNQFNTVVGDLGFAEAVEGKLGISPYEALIVASLAQVEAGNAEDLGKVARVAYNRLYKDFACKCLQFDVTANYWLELNGKPTKSSAKLLHSELHDPKNPYNTHDVAGLPIGPISNPGKAALDGAMNPATGNWFYFVAIDKEGHSAFAETLSQHDANKALACKNGVLQC